MDMTPYLVLSPSMMGKAAERSVWDSADECSSSDLDLPTVKPHNKSHRSSCSFLTLPIVLSSTPTPEPPAFCHEESPFAAAGAELALAIKTNNHDGQSDQDLTPRALYSPTTPTGMRKQWTTQLDEAYATIKALRSDLEGLRRVHHVALEELGAQEDRVAELEADMSSARSVLAEQATMLANIDAIVRQRIADAMQPVVDASQVVEDEDARLQEQLHVMICSSDSTSFMLY